MVSSGDGTTPSSGIGMHSGRSIGREGPTVLYSVVCADIGELQRSRARGYRIVRDIVIVGVCVRWWACWTWCLFCNGCRVCVCLRQVQIGAYDLIGWSTVATASSASTTTAAQEIDRARIVSAAELMGRESCS